ncbi:hypothetical protein MVEN_01281300 [Mycena venus]|uniref:Uncharacterized protein n=1 Tax=Mycena venus TaxID=2733690 RepID=A0A8H7CVS4_9AGAR|nr:hypothetical protein MVEN_01281300 [Mycena venus]
MELSSFAFILSLLSKHATHPDLSSCGFSLLAKQARRHSGSCQLFLSGTRRLRSSFATNALFVPSPTTMADSYQLTRTLTASSCARIMAKRTPVPMCAMANSSTARAVVTFSFGLSSHLARLLQPRISRPRIKLTDTNDTCLYHPPEHNLLGGPTDKCPSSLGSTPLPDPGRGCPFTNNSGEKLTADTGDEQGVVTCTYTNEMDTCLYVDAKLIRGPSNCPPLTPDPGISPGIAAVAIEDDTPSRISSITHHNIGDKNMGATQPILVALLVVNSVTVLVMLTIAGIWVVNCRAAGSSDLHSAVGGYKTVASMPEPVTHSDNGPLYRNS